MFSNEHPEVCPCCGADNWDEANEQWIHRSEAFCSDVCEGDYIAAQQAADDAYAAAVQAEDKFWKENQVQFEQFWRECELEWERRNA